MGWSAKNVSMSTPLGNVGGAVGDAGKSVNVNTIGKKWDEVSGTADRQKAAESLGNASDVADQGYDETVAQNKALDEQTANDDIASKNLNNRMNDTVKAATDPYISSLQNNMKEAENQASDGRATYKQSIEPTFKNNMEEAMRNAQGAMSLEDAGNANNALQTGIRNQFDQQAAGTMNQGAASSGVLQALGAQESNQQAEAPGGPLMSGGAIQANMQQNQGAAQNAMAGGMARASDLQNQGISLAQSMNDQTYQAGQDAQAKAAQTVGDYQDADLGYQDMSRTGRGEQTAIGGELAGTQGGVQQGMYDRNVDNITQAQTSAQDQAARDAAAINQKYGTKIAAKNAQGQASSANAGGILGTGGAIGGKILGGLMA